jgi:hypothetical protein
MILKILFDYLFPVQEGMINIGSAIKKALAKPFAAITQVLSVVTRIFTSLEKIGMFLGAVFVSIGSYLDCGVFYIGNFFSYCIIYYFVYLAALIIYAPFALLFWATGSQNIENMIWDIGSTINEFTADISGIDINDYLFPDKCYKCNLKPMPTLKL